MAGKTFEQLLKEESERFKSINEYTFYPITEQEPVEDEVGEEPVEGGEEPVEGGEMELAPEEPIGDEGGFEDEFADDPMGGDEGSTEEVDVTDLVKNSEETMSAIDSVNDKLTQMDNLMAKIDDLENKLSGMNAIVDKIGDLEQEFEKRNPTPEEKLDMRSLDSYPFNMKLTDFWKDKEGFYDVMGNQEPEEYTLTQDDVNDYNSSDIARSFKPGYEE